jgi:hypothetical protein
VLGGGTLIAYNTVITGTGATINGGHQFNNYGTITVTGSLTGSANAQLRNSNNGTINLLTGGNLLGSAWSVVNTGTLAKINSTDTSSIAASFRCVLRLNSCRWGGVLLTFPLNSPYSNSKTVDVLSGTLALAGGGSSTGLFNVQSTLTFTAGTTVLDQGSVVQGAGAVSFTGGSTTIVSRVNISGATSVAGGQVYLSSLSAIQQLGSTVTVSAGLLSVSSLGVTLPNTTCSGGSLTTYQTIIFSGDLYIVSTGSG